MNGPNLVLGVSYSSPLLIPLLLPRSFTQTGKNVQNLIRPIQFLNLLIIVGKSIKKVFNLFNSVLNVLVRQIYSKTFCICANWVFRPNFDRKLLMMTSTILRGTTSTNVDIFYNFFMILSLYFNFFSFQWLRTSKGHRPTFAGHKRRPTTLADTRQGSGPRQRSWGC